jgi:hypothetical protein
MKDFVDIKVHGATIKIFNFYFTIKTLPLSCKDKLVKYRLDKQRRIA